ncbi:hypothetical protein PILCRDRAFT_825146 [Piloderma croceum F 1598]|uniref:DUF6830 domain-containing protein n=1 Tax=Piloderma croceum (strain F 1598) TaxID=765440 RepID=A0A0C3FCZ4_PILCF|nr:hypothetical protein PILCRDRAFT_825146 [Piloderma croceum F 1598]
MTLPRDNVMDRVDLSHTATATGALMASPLSKEWPVGRYDTVLVNTDPNELGVQHRFLAQ